jgi:hypothetical protein
MAKALANTPNEEFTKPEGIQTVTVDRYSNKLPTDLSTEKTTDIFASWQVPTEQDDVHKKVRLCKGMNKLAPDGLAENLIEEKIVTIIHSEKPDNANWENPVRAWLGGSGLLGSVPTEYCSATDLTPTISIISPASGLSISGPHMITTASTGSPVPVKAVEFFIDNVSIGTASADPFSQSYDFSTMTAGSHTISVVATSENSATVKSEVVVTVTKPVPEPMITSPKPVITPPKEDLSKNNKILP